MLSQEHYREALSNLAAGTLAITAMGSDGRPTGLLATAAFSYSTKPPTIVVSISHDSRSHDTLTRAETIGVFALSHAQLDVAVSLSSKSNDKFAPLAWSWHDDVPCFGDALASMICRRDRVIDYLDHTLVFAEVQTSWVAPGDPLIYFRHSLTSLKAAACA